MEQHRVAAEDAARRPLSREQAEGLVIATITRHADSLLRVARRHSLAPTTPRTPTSAAMEIFLRHARRLDAERAPEWLHTVVKHEAMAVRAQRSRTVGDRGVDLDATGPHGAVARGARARLDRVDPVGGGAAAPQAPGAARAVAEGARATSYRRSASRRLDVHEGQPLPHRGRRSFLERYAGIEAGEECRRWAARAVGDRRR